MAAHKVLFMSPEERALKLNHDALLYPHHLLFHSLNSPPTSEFTSPAVSTTSLLWESDKQMCARLLMGNKGLLEICSQLAFTSLQELTTVFSFFQ